MAGFVLQLDGLSGGSSLYSAKVLEFLHAAAAATSSLLKKTTGIVAIMCTSLYEHRAHRTRSRATGYGRNVDRRRTSGARYCLSLSLIILLKEYASRWNDAPLLAVARWREAVYR